MFYLVLFHGACNWFLLILSALPNVWFLPAYSPVCFITVGIVWWPGLLYFELLCLHCNGACDSFRLVPLLDSRPGLYACTTCLLICIVWVAVVPLQPYTHSPTNWGIWVFAECTYNPLLGNAGVRPSYLLRSLLICGSNFSSVLDGLVK